MSLSATARTTIVAARATTSVPVPVSPRRPPHRVEQRLVLGQALVVRHHQDAVATLEVVAERLGAVERPFLVRAGEELVDQVASQAPVVLGGALHARELHRQHRRAVLDRDAVLGPGGALVSEHEHAVSVAGAGGRQQAIALSQRVALEVGTPQQLGTPRWWLLRVGVGPVRSGPGAEVAVRVLDGNRVSGELVQHGGDALLPLTFERDAR